LTFDYARDNLALLHVYIKVSEDETSAYKE